MTHTSETSKAASRLRVVITGGGSGLGLAMAQEFERQGHSVVICGRDEQKLEKAKALCGGLHVLRADLTSASDRASLMRDAANELGGIDVLINNAAICRVHRFDGAPHAIEPDIDTNLIAPLDLTRRLLEQRGSSDLCTIVNVSTGGALIPLAATPLYSATKAGLHSFTEALRIQLARTPVRIVEVFPPLMNTGLIDELEVTGAGRQGAEVIAAFARRAVRGIVRGDRRVADPTFVVLSALLRIAPKLVSWIANRATKAKQ